MTNLKEKLWAMRAAFGAAAFLSVATIGYFRDDISWGWWSIITILSIWIMLRESELFWIEKNGEATFTLQWPYAHPKIVFISDGIGDDSKDGTTPMTPVKTEAAAKKLNPDYIVNIGRGWWFPA